MKRIQTILGGALAAAALFATTGCETIREYSVNSYQGVLPAGDSRASGSVTPTAVKDETPRPSVPEAPVTASPAAGGPVVGNKR
jgi:hypothetical protein